MDIKAEIKGDIEFCIQRAAHCQTMVERAFAVNDLELVAEWIDSATGWLDLMDELRKELAHV